MWIKSYLLATEEEMMGVEFDSTDGILDEDSALDAWLNHYGLTMKYIAIPTRMPGIMARGAVFPGIGQSGIHLARLWILGIAG